MLYKIGVLKNFATFTGKIFKKGLQQKCFSVNVAKFLRTAIFIEHL